MYGVVELYNITDDITTYNNDNKGIKSAFEILMIFFLIFNVFINIHEHELDNLHI